MASRQYKIPRQGEIWKLDPDPNSEGVIPVGHEQQDYRPYLVISIEDKNRFTHVTTCVPVTHTDNSFPAHVELPQGMKAVGFVETEHVNTYDFSARHSKYVDTVPDSVLDKVLDMIVTSLGL